jgi:hypothetical protein
MESFLPWSSDAMSQNRSLVSCFVAVFFVACGGDEDIRFSSVDAAVEAGGGEAGTAGHAGDGGSSSGSGGSTGGGGNAASGGSSGSPNDGAGPDSIDPPDSGTPDTSPEGGTGGTAGDAGSDAGGSAGSVLDAGLDGCARPTVYYADKDKDGHGSAATSAVGCSPPATGTWVATATDCNDDDSRVHPGQAAYFAAGYRTASGSTSFDYDCSGSENEDPSQAKAPQNCGLLSITFCAGEGYAATARVGQGLSPYCGSSEWRICRGVVLCENATEVADEPFRCR